MVAVATAHANLAAVAANKEDELLKIPKVIFEAIVAIARYLLTGGKR